jgi:BirA family transcriptional regulator, biotin operon repressor / biotin---[acetyl-CoA-carboxylase] ligase
VHSWSLPPGLAFEATPEIDSTNAELMRRARAGALHQALLLTAEQQSAGRGRLGRPWAAERGQSLLMSLAWPMPLAASLDGLSLALGVAAGDALERLSSRAVRLKWPNDLLLDGAKLGGILVESVASSGVRWVVAGIGVNVHSAAHLGASWLNSADGKAASIAVDTVGSAIAGAWHGALEGFTREGFSRFHARWHALHAWQGQAVTAVQAGVVQSGTAIGVDQRGALLLQLADGGLRVVDSLETTLRLA